MKPIEFKEQSIVYAKNQPPYLPLPAFHHSDDWKCVTSCWGLSLKERFILLFTGKVWASLPTFGKPLTPLKLSVYKPELT